MYNTDAPINGWLAPGLRAGGLFRQKAGTTMNFDLLREQHHPVYNKHRRYKQQSTHFYSFKEAV